MAFRHGITVTEIPSGMADGGSPTRPIIITSVDPGGSYPEGLAIAGRLTATGPVTWSVAGADASRVTLDATTGAWSLAATDREAKASYAWTFIATDATGQTAQQPVAIAITNVAEVMLSPLTLSASVLAEGAAQGTAVGTLQGTSSGSTLALIANAGGRFQLAGSAIQAGPTATDYESLTTHQITVRETHPDSPVPGYRETTLTIAIGNVAEQPALGALLLSTTSLTSGQLVTVTITGTAAGSTITVASGSLPAGMLLNSAARTITGTPSAPGKADFELGEALADSPNTGRKTPLSLTVSATATTLPQVASITGFGSSSVVGEGASATANRFINILQSRTGATTLRNKGISGTVLQSSPGADGNPVTGAGATGRQRFAAALLGSEVSDLYFFTWPNDVRYTGNTAAFNPASYARDLREVLNGMAQAGIAMSRVYIGTPTWYPTDRYAMGGSGFAGSSDTINQAYRQATQDVAAEYGCYFADIYAAIQAVGAGAFVSGDVHWNNTGHAAAADAFSNSVILNSAARPGSLSATSMVTGRLDASWSAVAGAASYEVQAGAAGSYKFDAGSASPTGTTASVTGLSGSVQWRVRAVFSNGTKGPWAFSTAVVAIQQANPGTPFFNETFTAPDGTLLTNHTSDSGAPWALGNGAIATGGAPTIINGRIYNTGSAGVFRAQVAAPSADYYVDAVYDYVGTAGSENNGFCIRMQADANSYYWARYNSAGWALFKTLNGTPTQLGSTVADTFASGSRAPRLQAEGNVISLSLDGGATTAISEEDTNNPILGAGSPGLRVLQVPSTGGRQITQISATAIGNTPTGATYAGTPYNSASDTPSGAVRLSSYPSYAQAHAAARATPAKALIVDQNLTIAASDLGKENISLYGEETAPGVLPVLTYSATVLSTTLAMLYLVDGGVALRGIRFVGFGTIVGAAVESDSSPKYAFIGDGSQYGIRRLVPFGVDIPDNSENGLGLGWAGTRAFGMEIAAPDIRDCKFDDCEQVFGMVSDGAHCAPIHFHRNVGRGSWNILYLYCSYLPDLYVSGNDWGECKIANGRHMRQTSPGGSTLKSNGMHTIIYGGTNVTDHRDTRGQTIMIENNNFHDVEDTYFSGSANVNAAVGIDLRNVNPASFSGYASEADSLTATCSVTVRYNNFENLEGKEGQEDSNAAYFKSLGLVFEHNTIKNCGAKDLRDDDPTSTRDGSEGLAFINKNAGSWPAGTASKFLIFRFNRIIDPPTHGDFDAAGNRGLFAVKVDSGSTTGDGAPIHHIERNQFTRYHYFLPSMSGAHPGAIHTSGVFKNGLFIRDNDFFDCNIGGFGKLIDVTTGSGTPPTVGAISGNRAFDGPHVTYTANKRLIDEDAAIVPVNNRLVASDAPNEAATFSMETDTASAAEARLAPRVMP